MINADVYAWAANAVLALHAAFVLFVVGGQLFVLHGWYGGWSWTRGLVFRIAHLVAVGFVVVESWLDFACPLTLMENELRVHAGQAAYQDTGCIAYWLQKLLFYSPPNWMFDVLYTAFAALVLLCFVLYPPRRNTDWKRRSNRGK